MKVSEIFGPVVQGEGLRVGTPSIFLRLFGCNLRCPMFNIESFNVGDKNQEVQNLIFHLSDYQTLNDLPQVKTGCDTYYAIYPEFKKFRKDISVDEVAQDIVSRCASSKGKRLPDLVITGGEPLLHQRELLKLFSETSLLYTIKNVTFETNGTQPLSQELSDYFQFNFVTQWLFSISPKLYNSGHTRFDTLCPQAIKSYCNHDHQNNIKIVLKFVISFDRNIEKTKEDCLDFIRSYRSHDVIVDEVYIMPEGAIFDDHYLNNARKCIDWCIEMGFNYSPRLQVELFGNGVGT